MLFNTGCALKTHPPEELILPVLIGLVWGGALESVLLKASQLILRSSWSWEALAQVWGKEGRYVKKMSGSFSRGRHRVENHRAPLWLNVHRDMQDRSSFSESCLSFNCANRMHTKSLIVSTRNPHTLSTWLFKSLLENLASCHLSSPLYPTGTLDPFTLPFLLLMPSPPRPHSVFVFVSYA